MTRRKINSSLHLTSLFYSSFYVFSTDSPNYKIPSFLGIMDEISKSNEIKESNFKLSQPLDLDLDSVHSGGVGSMDLRLLELDASRFGSSLDSDLDESPFNPAEGPTLSASSMGKKSTDRNTTVIWTTPIGLPIAQPYRVLSTKQVKTHMQVVSIPDDKKHGPVNARKQATAFPPNFIHSLDASHMMLSAVTCHHNSLTFASVHDSYWTHGCDIDKMNDILRQCFVKLHTEPILERLKNELESRYADYKLPIKISIPPSLENEYLEYCDSIGIRNNQRKKGEGVGKGFGSKDTSSTSPSSSDPLNPTTSKRKRTISTWMDMEFPDLPPVGTLDIQSVRDSAYFFH